MCVAIFCEMIGGALCLDLKLIQIHQVDVFDLLIHFAFSDFHFGCIYLR
jgi:hypothetical protein